MPAPAAPLQDYRIVAEYPHDAGAYTEGLLYENGHLYESTGRAGHSSLREVELASGRVLRQVEMPAPDFGEGIAHVDHHWLQMTWQSGFGYVYDDSFKRAGSFPILTEGWGMTWDGHQLITSDGSSALYFLDPKTYAERRELTVRDDGAPVRLLNELEWVNGLIYANIFTTDRIAVIDAQSGVVKAWLDMSRLHSRFTPPAGFDPNEDVLNGIAYNAGNGHFYVTGKCWPKLFEIELLQH